jgi:hypothetical protein
MFDTSRDDEQLPRFQLDRVLVPQAQREMAGVNEEEFVGVLVGMPDELPVDLGDLQLIAVDVRRGMRLPVLVERRERFAQVDLAAGRFTSVGHSSETRTAPRGGCDGRIAPIGEWNSTTNPVGISPAASARARRACGPLTSGV